MPSPGEFDVWEDKTDFQHGRWDGGKGGAKFVMSGVSDCVCLEIGGVYASKRNFEMRTNLVFTTVFVRHLVQKPVDIRSADDAVAFEATSSFERFGG